MIKRFFAPPAALFLALAPMAAGGQTLVPPPGGSGGATACAGLSDASSFCNGTNAANLTGSIPAGRLNVDSAEVATSETTASSGYGDLATAGPALTFTTTGTKATVCVSAGMSRASGTGNTAYMGVAVSGASTVAASDNQSAKTSPSTAAFNNSLAACFPLTGLTAGSNTFTAKYRVDGGTMAFFNRGILVYAP